MRSMNFQEFIDYLWHAPKCPVTEINITLQEYPHGDCMQPLNPSGNLHLRWLESRGNRGVVGSEKVRVMDARNSALLLTRTSMTLDKAQEGADSTSSC